MSHPLKRAGGLSRIRHFVVLMLENRSFDHLLGFLYADHGNRSPLGHPFEGLTGKEGNRDGKGKERTVFRIDPADPYRYFYPKADPGEGFHNTNAQLFGTTRPAPGAKAENEGFLTNFAATLAWQRREKNGHWNILPGTRPEDILGIYTPELLPVLSGLARGYAVCDHWYSSAPTETIPNRAFALAATSQGHLGDDVKHYTVPTLCGLMESRGLSWSIYGYDQQPLTRHTFADISGAPDERFGTFKDFQGAVRTGKLASFAFLEPSWGSHGNSQHPNYDVAAGEALIREVYGTLFASPVWKQTLLIITYDEHGGCFDHVPPPETAVAPDDSIGEYGFGFDRFGIRVPAVLVSPWIEAGTVYRVNRGTGGAPRALDHTSILKTVERRFGLPSLTRRDAAAPDLGGVLTLARARTDDPLAGVPAPKSPSNPVPDRPSHLQDVQAQLLSGVPARGQEKGMEHHEDTAPGFKTGTEADRYIRKRNRLIRWKGNSGPARGRPKGGR